MRTKKLIVVEEVLAGILSAVPAISVDNQNYYKPIFSFGNSKQLSDFIRQKKSEGTVYPLIWLVYPLVERHTPSAVYFDNMQLIIAVENIQPMLNDERMITTYKLILMKLANDIIACFRKSNVSNINDEITIVKYPNYSDDAATGDSNKKEYTWDAIKITISGSFSGNCLKPIYLNP